MGLDSGMDERRVASLVIAASGVGLVVGRLLFARDIDDIWSVWAGHYWVTLGLSLVLLGLAIWHFLRFGVGTLVAIGLLAIVALLFTINDFADGDPLWSREYREDARLVGAWLIVASTVVVLIGVLWSAGQHLTDVTASGSWWRRPWAIAVGGVAVLSIIGSISFIRFRDDPAVMATDTVDDGDDGMVLVDEWSISPDGDSASSYIFSMIKTFSIVEGADVEEPGGRLIWPETEIELCDVNIWGLGEGFVQIGIVSPTTEGCPGMLPAFVDFGVPKAACLFVRSNGVDDEYCAPLAEIEPEP